MKIERFALYRYFNLLHRPLPVPGAAITEREGVLLQLTADSGEVGWGEIAPLAGVSPESLSEAVDASVALLPALRGVVLDAQLILSPSTESPCIGLPPSAAFGVECAMLDLLCSASRVPLRRVCGVNPANTIRVNALLSVEDETLEERAAQLNEEGVPAIKIKIGRGDPKEEGERVRNLARTVTGQTPLRLDANRAWELSEAELFLAALQAAPVEYFEEPLRDSSGLPELVRRWDLPLALDESLLEPDFGGLDAAGPIAAVVLKPSRLGRVGTTLNWAQQACDAGAYSVISSLYESGVGTRVLAQLAACVNTKDVPCGLDPHRWIREDIVDAGLPAGGWQIDLEQIDRTIPVVETGRLEEISNG
jgi:O-succinylbenzoate synthase